MKHASQCNVGRPTSAATSSPTLATSRDKWALLSALSDAADLYELNHRTLSVLKALLTFWPERDLKEAPNSCIVFPSNKTLSERLNGMPESTLRRHLSQLINLGIVSRHDSPNQKRYARRVAGALQQAYGFDLSPLARHAEHLLLQAHCARQAYEQLLILRDRVANLRQEILTRSGDTELTEQARIALRRKPASDPLKALELAMSDTLDDLKDTDMTPTFATLTSAEVSTTDDQNERHIQYSIKQSFDSERAEKENHEKPDDTQTNQPQNSALKDLNNLTPAQVLVRCRESQSFFPDPVRSWSDLVHLADRLAPMLGIDQPVLAQAKQYMGATSAAISLLCILERASEIRSPGAYLRRLTQKASSGAFSVLPMLSALKTAH